MTSIVLLSTSILFLSSIIVLSLMKKTMKLSIPSTVVLSVAGFTYLLMYFFGSVDNLRVLRYIDWFITLPILIYQMMTFMEKKFFCNKNIIITTILTLLMLVFGFLGELNFSDNWSLVVDGRLWDLRPEEFKVVCGFMGIGFGSNVFLFLSYGVRKNTIKFFLLVLLLWSWYPIIYFFSDNISTIIGYSIIDLIAKIGSSFYIDNRRLVHDN